MLRHTQKILALAFIIGLMSFPATISCQEAPLNASSSQNEHTVTSDHNAPNNVFSDRDGDNDDDDNHAGTNDAEEKMSTDQHIFNFEEDENDFE